MRSVANATHRLVVGLGGELGQPSRRLDGVVIVREERAIFLDGARRIAELLGEAAHHGVRTVGARRHRHELRRFLERLERRLVAFLGERQAERQLRAIAARMLARGRLEKRDVAARTRLARPPAWRCHAAPCEPR